MTRSRAMQWIQLINAGYDPLEETGLPPHIKVTTRGAIGAGVIAEHALTLLLASMRAIPQAVRAGDRAHWGLGEATGGVRSLTHSRVGIVGFGPIGRALAQRLVACGAEISAFARSARVDATGVQVWPLSQLDHWLPALDALAIACPLTHATDQLINAQRLKILKPGAHIVNIARGRIIDNLALAAALHEGHLGGAALDVTDPEPLPAGHALWRAPRMVLTPHVAFLGGGAIWRTQLEALVLNNAQRFQADQPLSEQIVIDPTRVIRS